MMNLPFSNGGSGGGERTVLHRPLPSPRGDFVREVRLLPVLAPGSGPPDDADKRRSKIWDLGESLHCSIIGTCLSAAELRQILARTGVVGIDKASDHDMHMLGVLAAGRREAGGRLVQKALDRRHRSALTQFAKAANAAELRVLWDDAVKKGDIPGAYWAVLTHPASSVELVKHVFGEIHMLSHLVGAANRADIRRLCQLEEENAALNEKLSRQQRHLREALAVRDEAILRFNERTAATGECGSDEPDARNESDPQILIDDLSRRLSTQVARAARLQERINTLSASLDKTQEARRRAEDERGAMRTELNLTDERIDALLVPNGLDETPFNLTGSVLLYVGGRAHQVPKLRAMIERLGGQLLHHDGGVDDNAALLPGLIGRADTVLFPVDCVSHGAVASVKRMCSHSGKRYIPLRTSSLTCLLAAVGRDDRTLPAGSEASRVLSPRG